MQCVRAKASWVSSLAPRLQSSSGTELRCGKGFIGINRGGPPGPVGVCRASPRERFRLRCAWVGARSHPPVDRNWCFELVCFDAARKWCLCDRDQPCSRESTATEWPCAWVIAHSSATRSCSCRCRTVKAASLEWLLRRTGAGSRLAGRSASCPAGWPSGFALAPAKRGRYRRTLWS